MRSPTLLKSEIYNQLQSQTITCIHQNIYPLSDCIESTCDEIQLGRDWVTGSFD